MPVSDPDATFAGFDQSPQPTRYDHDPFQVPFIDLVNRALENGREPLPFGLMRLDGGQVVGELTPHIQVEPGIQYGNAFLIPAGHTAVIRSRWRDEYKKALHITRIGVGGSFKAIGFRAAFLDEYPSDIVGIEWVTLSDDEKN